MDDKPFQKELSEISEQITNFTVEDFQCIKCGYCCEFWETQIPENNPLFEEFSNLAKEKGLLPFEQITKISIAFRGRCRHRKQQGEIGFTLDEDSLNCDIHNDINRPEICKNFYCWKDAPTPIFKGFSFVLEQKNIILKKIINNQSYQELFHQHPEMLAIITLLILNHIQKLLITQAQKEVGLLNDLANFNISSETLNEITKFMPANQKIIMENIIKSRLKYTYPYNMTKRNEKCPCGSEKKFKQCCGK